MPRRPKNKGVVVQEDQEKKGGGKQDQLVADMAATQISTTGLEAGPSTAKQDILYIKPGRGGTFKFEVDDEGMCRGILVNGVPTGIKYVGTDDCNTCVGIYFEIPGNRFFGAHLNFWHRSTDETTLSAGKLSSRYKENMEWDVKKRLEEHVVRYRWAPADVDTKTVKMVCPKRTEVSDKLVLCIKDFFGGRRIVVDKQHGFWVQPGGEVTRLYYNPDAADRVEWVEHGFKKRYAKLPKGEWKYSCDKRWDLKEVPKPSRGPEAPWESDADPPSDSEDVLTWQDADPESGESSKPRVADPKSGESSRPRVAESKSRDSSRARVVDPGSRDSSRPRVTDAKSRDSSSTRYVG